MRIGRFNQIINNATDTDGKLQTHGIARHGGQVFVIDNFDAKAELVLELQALGLLPSDNLEPVIAIFEENVNAQSLEVEAVQHNEIVSLFTKINAKLPIYLEITENFSPDQEETVINVKLPIGISSLGELQTFNKRLETLFKKFNFTGNFKVVGFDVGSEWYQILIDNISLFSIFISSVSLALQAIDFRDSRKNSDDLRLTKKALDARDPNNDVTELKFLNSMVDEKITEDVEKSIDELGITDGRDKPETLTMVIGAVKELIKEIDKGTEFHLSLNPPEYAEEEGGSGAPSITIDYSQIPSLDVSQTEAAQLEAGDGTESEENSLA